GHQRGGYQERHQHIGVRPERRGERHYLGDPDRDQHRREHQVEGVKGAKFAHQASCVTDEQVAAAAGRLGAAYLSYRGHLTPPPALPPRGPAAGRALLCNRGTRAVEPRITSSTGKTIRPGPPVRPAIAATAVSAACRPSWLICCRIVVSAGLTSWDMKMSSKPATDRSRPTVRP